jgi:ATP-dependent Clp protease adaptor protein ClpS
LPKKDYISSMSDKKTHKLIMHNDDINSYQYIMACLIRFCQHEPIQAEQCALIAHNKGKCNIKTGNFMELFDLKSTFENVNVKTEVEAYETNESSLY